MEGYSILRRLVLTSYKVDNTSCPTTRSATLYASPQRILPYGYSCAPAEADVLSRDDDARVAAYVRVRRLPPVARAPRTQWPCTSTVIPLEIWDCPGTVALDTLEAPLSAFASTVFVIDIQVGGR